MGWRESGICTCSCGAPPFDFHASTRHAPVLNRSDGNRRPHPLLKHAPSLTIPSPFRLLGLDAPALAPCLFCLFRLLILQASTTFPDAPAIFLDAPTLAPSRSKSFQIPSVIAVYGSFLIQIQASSRQNVDENARKSKYSTRSKDLKRPRTGNLSGAKNPAKCRNVKHRKEEDNEEADETLGGFISHTSQIITRIEGGR